MYNGRWICQQDITSFHKTSNTTKWIENKKVDLLDYPAKSGDLNRIENMFGVAVRRVYVSAPQFDTVVALKTFILDWRSKFDLQTC